MFPILKPKTTSDGRKTTTKELFAKMASFHLSNDAVKVKGGKLRFRVKGGNRKGKNLLAAVVKPPLKDSLSNSPVPLIRMAPHGLRAGN